MNIRLPLTLSICLGLAAPAIAHAAAPTARMAADTEWRSAEFQKARAEVKAVMDKRGGNAVILEVTRTSPSQCAVLSEILGEGAAWTLVAFPKSDTSKTPKPIEVADKAFDGMVLQTRPARFTLAVPENETEMTFVMSTQVHRGAMWVKDQELMWAKKLPAVGDAPKIMVFYVPRDK